MKKWMSVLLLGFVVSAFGQAWFMEVVDSTGNVGQHSSLAIDKKNSPHIAYWDVDSTRLKYATWNGTKWDVEVVDNNSGLGGVGKYASLALGPNTERPQIAYYDSINGQLKWANLNAAGDWIVGIPDPNTNNDVGQSCDLVIGEQSGAEVPHFSYYDATAGYLMYARSMGSVWARDTIDSVGANLSIFGTYVQGTSIVLDANGNPHIAYFARDSFCEYLKYAYMASGNWVIDTIERDSGKTLGLWPEIILTKNNLPYISYYDASNGYFKYARWTGSSWAIDIIDNTPGVGLYGSQVLGSTYASYYDSANTDLKYAYSDNYLGWHTESVDTAGSVGRFTSISLSHKGPINFPHISYYDETNGNLKYATKIIKDVLPVSWKFQNKAPNWRQVKPDSMTDSIMITIRNQSNTVAACSVTCEIKYSGIRQYREQVSISPPLEIDAEKELSFPPWKAPNYEDVWYYLEIITWLPDDSLKTNDTIIDSVQALKVGIEEKNPVSPTYELVASGSVVNLELPRATQAELYLVDVAGRRRLTLEDGILGAGSYSYDISKHDLPNGVYFIRYTGETVNLSKKMVLIR